MIPLHNKLDEAQLKAALNKEQTKRITLSFYRYTPLDNLEPLRDAIYSDWLKLGVLGRVYIAHEGINAQLSVPENKKEEFLDELSSHAAFKDMPLKFAVEEGKSFYKLIVKVKKEIVAYGIANDEYDMENIGEHLNYKAFNQALNNGATVLDMRNNYEAEVGHFENAIIPDVVRSQELLPEVKRLLQGKEEEPVLIYCTGGIRCEKASAYLKHHGFKNVNQLHGGVIQYANDIANSDEKSKFIGKNFVFDARMGERVTEDIISQCHQCDEPSDRHTNCANRGCHILFIQCEHCSEALDNCCSKRCAEFITLPIEEQRTKRREGSIKFTAQLSDNIKPNLKKLRDNNLAIE